MLEMSDEEMVYRASKVIDMIQKVAETLEGAYGSASVSRNDHIATATKVVGMVLAFEDRP